MTEAPMGEIEREPEVPDPAVVREAEALAVKQGRELYATAALDADGTVVAYTNFGVNTEGSPRAYQWGTLVRARAPRPPARPGGQGRQPPAAPGAPGPTSARSSPGTPRSTAT